MRGIERNNKKMTDIIPNVGWGGATVLGGAVIPQNKLRYLFSEDSNKGSQRKNSWRGGGVLQNSRKKIESAPQKDIFRS